MCKNASIGRKRFLSTNEQDPHCFANTEIMNNAKFNTFDVEGTVNINAESKPVSN